ncbi:MAG: hypothetical protein LBT70_03060 [Holosporaceae bacterium]|jgi:glutamate-1-semialdehyde aminotransferase|nr:hypothetical protein [Holosporaceae bacterium]
MKQLKKLDTINDKITNLAKQKKALEDEITQSVAKQVAAILIKKRATKINIAAFFEKIEDIVDEMKNED